MSDLYQTKRQYSHRIIGIYTMTEPDNRSRKLGHWASMNGEQYFEASATGISVPFRFLRELLLHVNGKRLYASYYESLAIIAKRLSEHLESYIRRNGLVLDKAAMDKEKMKGSLGVRIMVSLLRDDETKVDADCAFFIDGASKPVTDIDEVFRAKGLTISAAFIKELLLPLSQARVNPENEDDWMKRRSEDEERRRKN